MQINKLTADNFVQTSSVWCDRAEAVMHCDYLYPLLSRCQRYELQVSSIGRMHKVGGDCPHGRTRVDARLVTNC